MRIAVIVALGLLWQAPPAPFGVRPLGDRMASVIFVVGDSGALTAGDTSIKSRMEGLGHAVTVTDDGDAETGSGFDAVVVSETVSSTTFGTKYKASAKGVMVLEQGTWDDYDLQTTNTTASSPTQIAIASVAGLDAGFGGTTVTVFSSSSTWHRETTSNLGSGVQVVGTITTDSTLAGYYAYESGAALVSGNAAGRRVAFSLVDASVANLTADGWLLFDAAVTWTIGAVGGGGSAILRQMLMNH